MIMFVRKFWENFHRQDNIEAKGIILAYIVPRAKFNNW